MVGVACQFASGEIDENQLRGLLETPLEAPGFILGRAKARGLTMKQCKFKDGFLFKVPQYISEERFLRGYKKKLKEMGVDYRHPYEKQNDSVGGLFPSSSDSEEEESQKTEN